MDLISHVNTTVKLVIMQNQTTSSNAMAFALSAPTKVNKLLPCLFWQEGAKNYSLFKEILLGRSSIRVP